MEAKRIVIWRDKMDPNMFSIGYQWQTSSRFGEVKVIEGCRLFSDCIWGLFGEATMKALEKNLKPGESMEVKLSLNLEVTE